MIKITKDKTALVVGSALLQCQFAHIFVGCQKMTSSDQSNDMPQVRKFSH